MKKQFAISLLVLSSVACGGKEGSDEVLTSSLKSPDSSQAKTEEAACSSYKFVSKWGIYGSGNSQFSFPTNVEVDRDDSVYVIDANRVQKFSSDGTYITQFGTKGSRAGQLYGPNALTSDVFGNILVLDTGNYRIQKFSSTGSFISQFSNTVGKKNYDRGIATDSSGNIFDLEAEYGINRIKKYSTHGKYISNFGATGAGKGQFDSPQNIAIDAQNNIYVTDSRNNRIQKFTSNGKYIMQFGTLGSGDGQFNFPLDITIDSAGSLYVTDYKNYRVQKFSSEGAYITQFGSQGDGDGQFNLMRGIATDSKGDVYIADTKNYRIQKFSCNDAEVSIN